MTSTLADLERSLHGLGYRHRRAALPRMIVMTDEARLADPAPVLAALPRGSAVIVRARNPAALAALASTIARSCRRLGHKLLIADDPALAYKLRADGVHLPEKTLRRERRRPAPARPDWLVTAAVHSEGAVTLAAAARVDAVLLSPVFPTPSHPGGNVLGSLRFRAIAGRSPVPVYALGGIGPAAVRRLRGSGAVGIAGIGFALGADA